MAKSRLEAFSDGVIAIIITILVLELRVPHEPTLSALGGLWPVFLTYVLSFIYIGIYWNNHHHMFHMTDRITGGILWANLHLLFWLSLIPFTTGWMGENHFAPVPTAFYGVNLFNCAIAYLILQTAIIRHQGQGSRLAAAVEHDVKGKISGVIYLVAILLAFVNPTLAGGLYILVALIWLVPDPRIERRIRDDEARRASERRTGT